MRRHLFIGLMLLPASAAAYTGQAESPHAIEREAVLDGCHFKMTDPYRGELDVDNDSAVHTASYNATINPQAGHPFETWIQFDCHNNVKLSDLPQLAGVGKVNGHWTIAFDGDAKALNTKLYTFRGNGWDGAGITQDQRDGEENRRTRAFTFCLLHGTQALCGSDNTVMYLAHPDESVLPQEIRLLESIQFIDTPTAKHGMPASSSTVP